MRDYEPYFTEDGSVGLYSYADKDVYHSKFGALTEAWEKFVLPSGIDKLLNNQNDIKILDVCYGIGYNSKALMSFIIDKNYIQLKRKNIILRFFNIVSIGINNILKLIGINLSSRNDTIHNNNSIRDKKINIDCMDINEEFIKLSPLFRTLKTPGEIYSDIVPQILTCFDSYYFFKKLFEKMLYVFYPKNKKYIRDLLELKFQNMHREKEYKVNAVVNYILLNSMYELFGKDYFNKDLIKSITKKDNSQFFEKYLIKYAKFNHKWGYNLSSKFSLSGFLHNIYYDRLSYRYKNIDFKETERLFNIKFHINDARKSIKQLNKLYDCIFLDAFSFTKAPQLWSVEFIAELYKRLSDHGVILTYSNSAQVRNTLLENKFYVGKIFNEKTGKFNGTIASKDKSKIKYPLSSYELGLCNTKAGIPYHDPNLSFSSEEIMELREYEFVRSNLMSSSKYMKIRSLRGDNA